MTPFPTVNQLWLLAVSLIFVTGFYLLREHWGHALGLAPYLLLLACPLLHLFHGHGGQRHKDRHHSGDKPGDRRNAL